MNNRRTESYLKFESSQGRWIDYEGAHHIDKMKNLDDYYAVIFSSKRTENEPEEYSRVAERMESIAKQQDGFIGIESSRGDDGFGITVSYWKCEESIRAWKRNAEHLDAQENGKSKWYKSFRVRVSKVFREYSSF